MKDYRVDTYDEAVNVIKELGFLPLANLITAYPSLDSITAKENWYTGSQLDPWLWRAQFPVDGTAAYGKFVKKKSVLIASEFLPMFRAILGSPLPVSDRYQDGVISKEALQLYTLIHENEGIDTRVLRIQAGMKEKEKKKAFDHALLELQSSMDIVVSGTKEKTYEAGEKNGWSSTSFETMNHWAKNHDIDNSFVSKDDAKMMLRDHFAAFCSPESIKAIQKLFGF
ncbi:hypothetical protein [Neobacillus niacini]|uniref:AlkZ-related protein n=1 Tax=Neobacillus niacini TaxID=86668 RepID=UPI003983BEB7